MKISRYFAALGLASLLFAFSACADYLDKDPENSVPEEDLDYTIISDMYQPVSGVYAAIRTGACHWIVDGMTRVRDDDMWSGRTDDQALLVDYGNYTYDNTFWGLKEMWNQYYNIIMIANAALTSLDSYAENITSTSDMATYRSYCGEVRYLRAFAYYQLSRAWGPVTILRTNAQTDLSRSTLNAVQNYMLEDLEYAIEYCEKLRPNEMEHTGAVTAYSAEHLAAKIHMDRAEYAEAQTLTDDIIDSGKFELYDDFYQLFKIPAKLCNESLFEVQCTDFGSSTADMVDVDCWFVWQGPGSMGGWNFMLYYETFYNWAVARGETIRATTTFLTGGGTETPSGDEITDGSTTTFFNGKAYTPTSQLTEGRTKYGANNNARVYRYADVLLINAEAKVRQGASGDTPFNLVRTRAEMPTVSGVTLDDILDERRMELAGEWGERYYDLIRTGNAASVLGDRGWTTDKTYYPVPYDHLTDYPVLANDPIDE